MVELAATIFVWMTIGPFVLVAGIYAVLAACWLVNKSASLVYRMVRSSASLVYRMVRSIITGFWSAVSPVHAIQTLRNTGGVR